MATNWPLGADDLRNALDYQPGQDSDAELLLFMTGACERIDRATGRHIDPTRHEIAGKVPTEFILWARALARLRWIQSKKGPRARPDADEPAGFDLPRWIDSGLSQYPAPLFVQEDT